MVDRDKEPTCTINVLLAKNKELEAEVERLETARQQAANKMKRLEIALQNIAATTIPELDYTFEQAQQVAKEALAESV